MTPLNCVAAVEPARPNMTRVSVGGLRVEAVPTSQTPRWQAFSSEPVCQKPPDVEISDHAEYMGLHVVKPDATIPAVSMALVGAGVAA